MLTSINGSLRAVVFATGLLLGLSDQPAQASTWQPPAAVQTVQYYYAPRPYAYRRPYYARPYPHFYGPRFYGRPYYRHGYYRRGWYR